MTYGHKIIYTRSIEAAIRARRIPRARYRSPVMIFLYSHNFVTFY